MAKYRKKPVVIDAVEWTGELSMSVTNLTGFSRISQDGGDLIIHTLEGDMRANVGDYIIKGVHGECYPCKPDIFAATYEAV